MSSPFARRSSLEMLSGGAFSGDKKKESTHELYLTDLVPNRDQVRTDFKDESLKSLAESIRNNGILQPIIVRPLKSAPGALRASNALDSTRGGGRNMKLLLANVVGEPVK